MKTARVIVVATLVCLAVAAASHASASFSCNSNGRLFRVSTPDLSPFNVTLMWTKSGADNDILVFFTDTNVLGDVVALGIGIEDRFERVTFGALPGIQYDIVALKASGPNSKCLFNVGAEVQATSAASGRRIRDLGSLSDLARSDPHFARIAETVRKYRAIKR